MLNFERHFCVTVYVFDIESNSFLFIKHKKLQKWLPPGGHIELNELPADAAIRECFEETGIHIKILGNQENFPGALISPLGMQLNIVKLNEHEHIDIIYLAKALNNTLSTNLVETEGVTWVNLDMILNPDFNTFDSIKYWCKKIACGYRSLL